LVGLNKIFSRIIDFMRRLVWRYGKKYSAFF
jgi:hypothetical protein